MRAMQPMPFLHDQDQDQDRPEVVSRRLEIKTKTWGQRRSALAAAAAASVAVARAKEEEGRLLRQAQIDCVAIKHTPVTSWTLALQVDSFISSFLVTSHRSRSASAAAAFVIHGSAVSIRPLLQPVAFRQFQISNVACPFDRWCY